MDGVVDSIQIQRLCPLCKVKLTGSGTVFGFHTHAKVLLGRGGDDVAQKLGKLGGVLGFLPSCLLKVLADLGIALPMCDSCHCQIHPHFHALGVEVGPEIGNNVLGSALRYADDVLGCPGTVVPLHSKLGCGSIADEAFVGSGLTLVHVAANSTDVFFACCGSGCSLCLAADFFKILGAVLAQGAEIVFGQLLSLVHVAADLATPTGLLGRSRLGSVCLNHRLIVAVGAVVCFGHDLAVHNLTDEEGVAAQIVRLGNLQRQKCAGPFGEIVKTVFASGHVGEIGEFIGVSARLHSKMPEQRKGCVGGDGGQIAATGCRDHIMGIGSLDYRNRHAGGIVCHLHGGVDNAGVILSALLCREQIHAVGEIIKRCRIHLAFLFSIIVCQATRDSYKPRVNQATGFRSVVEISVQETLERLAVTSLVTSHFVNGVVDRIQIQCLSTLCKVSLACSCTVLGVYSHLQVLLGGVGEHLTQQLCKLCSVLCFLISCLFPVQTDLGIALAMSNSCHCQVHTNLHALAVEVGAEIFHNIFGSTLCYANDMLSSPSLFAGLFLYHILAANGALCRGIVAFINITANGTYVFCHNKYLFIH